MLYTLLEFLHNYDSRIVDKNNNKNTHDKKY